MLAKSLAEQGQERIVASIRGTAHRVLNHEDGKTVIDSAKDGRQDANVRLGAGDDERSAGRRQPKKGE